MTHLKPYIFATLGIGLLTAMDGVVKELMRTLPFIQAVCLRFAMGAIVALAVVAIMRPPVPTRSSIAANLWRVPLVVATATTFFFSVRELPLAEAIALSFLSPLFVALFGLLLLKEHIDRRIVIAIGFGLVGMLVMLSPKLAAGITGSTPGVVAALAAAVFYALNLILLRKIAQNEHAAIIVAFQNAGPALLLAIPAFLVWQPISLHLLGLAFFGGLLAVSGHLLITRAFALATAARVATTEYTALIWASVVGFAAFGEVPALVTYLGAAFIIAGAWTVSRRSKPAEETTIAVNQSAALPEI
ncbi:MAG: DMT family transporter, partial [Bosea sp. (in: a-proteobacteria)]